MVTGGWAYAEGGLHWFKCGERYAICGKRSGIYEPVLSSHSEVEERNERVRIRYKYPFCAICEKGGVAQTMR